MPRLIQIDKNLYYFNCVLVTDEVDRDNEKFTTMALREMCSMFIGKTGIIDAYGTTFHLRIFDTKIKQKHGITKLKASAYVYINNEADVDKLRDFLSTHKECSISCCCARKVCSICGRNQQREHCPHVKGNVYGHKNCVYKLSGVTDVYEWAFAIEPDNDYEEDK
jgi:hypothetical protein